VETLTPTQQEILTGSLLGDGHLSRPKGHSAQSNLRIERAVKDEQYLLWEAQAFAEFLNPGSVYYCDIPDRRTGKVYHQVRLNTARTLIFGDYRRRWYADGGAGAKQVPDGIQLTPLSIAIWIADDGYVQCSKGYRESIRGREYPTSLLVRIATNSFRLDEVNRLRAIIEQLYGIKSTIETQQGDQHYIRFGSVHARELLRLIDPVFPPMPRKSELWRRPSAELWNTTTVYICPHCGADRMNKYGFQNDTQRFKCMKCMRTIQYKPESREVLL
jgi:hypothetical protein